MKVPTDFVHPTAEATVLSAMLNQTPIGFSIAANGLSADDFFSPVNAVIFAVLKDRLVTDMPIDPDTVAAEATNLAARRKAKGGRVLPSYVEQLVKHDYLRADAYSDTVKQMAVLRRASAFAEWFRQRLGEMPEPVELYAEAVEAIRDLQPEVADDRFMAGGDTVRWHASLLSQRRTQPDDELRLDWPWAEWNRFVRPLRSGQLALLAAPAGVGKTTYLEVIAEHWARTRHVVFVHLENDRAYTLDRRMARHSRATLEEIETGNVFSDEAGAAVDSIAAFATRLHYLHAAGWSMERVTSELAALVAAGRCEAIIFDYLNKTRPSHTQRQFYGTDQWARQADDAEQLKVFCETHGLAALMAAQMNKGGNEGYGKKTRLDIRGSQEVLDKVQLGVLVSRELADGDRYDGRGNLICRKGDFSPETLVQVVKQNSGRLGELTQFYVGAHFDVRDMAEV